MKIYAQKFVGLLSIVQLVYQLFAQKLGQKFRVTKRSQYYKTFYGYGGNYYKLEGLSATFSWLVRQWILSQPPTLLHNDTITVVKSFIL